MGPTSVSLRSFARWSEGPRKVLDPRHETADGVDYGSTRRARSGILIFKETEAAKDRAVRGRQVLYLFDQYFKTKEEVGSLYSVEDLLKVRFVVNDDLSTFLSNWENVISGLGHMPDETTLRDIFLRELRQSKKIKYDLEIYDRAKEGSEQHTYLFLKNSSRRCSPGNASVRTETESLAPMVTSMVRRLRRDLPAPLEEEAVRNHKARQVRDPEAQAEVGHKAPTSRNPKPERSVLRLPHGYLQARQQLPFYPQEGIPFPKGTKDPKENQQDLPFLERRNMHPRRPMQVPTQGCREASCSSPEMGGRTSCTKTEFPKT